jgi:hypothetical protein
VRRTQAVPRDRSATRPPAAPQDRATATGGSGPEGPRRSEARTDHAGTAEDEDDPAGTPRSPELVAARDQLEALYAHRIRLAERDPDVSAIDRRDDDAARLEDLAM